MPIKAEVLNRLLNSIEAQNLAVLCGAGLSIPAPSSLMSARDVARACYDKYQGQPSLDNGIRDDIEKIATHFHDAGQFDPLFISLVPWGELSGEPNAGHVGVTDLLISEAIEVVLTTNVDSLIEQSAGHRKVFLRGAVDGVEAVQFSKAVRPLLKFHGCMSRFPETTLWTPKQLNDDVVAKRIESSSKWMELNLSGKDLLVIGFSSDWDYLNSILEAALASTKAASVVVIDFITKAKFAEKAPNLWALLSAMPNFEYVEASSDVAVEELRNEFSRLWLRKLYAAGKAMHIESRGAEPTVADISTGLDTEALYDVRRDAEGRPAPKAARFREPPNSAARAGFAHILLAQKASARVGSWYQIDDQVVRVIQGFGESLATVKDRFREAVVAPPADVVVCVGASDDGTRGRVIQDGYGNSIVRPEGGGGSRWLTLEDAIAEFGL